MQTKIYKNTFKGCSHLKHIKLPNNISAIDDCAFQNCSSLIDIEMGTNVKHIGISAFENNMSLINVDRFSDNNSSHTFDTVGNYAFANTNLSSLNLSLRSSSIYTFWGDGCFQNCNNLKNVHFLSANYMSKNMFKDCIQLSSVQFDVPLMAYTYPGIFDGCKNLLSICLPSQLLFIPENMFNNCEKLKSLTFTTYDRGSSIDEIQQNAFNNSGINDIIFPSSIDSLNELNPKCFNNCKKLNSLTFSGIKSTQLLSANTYNIMYSEYNSIYLNEWYEFDETYYGLYSTYDDYINSNVDIYKDDDGYIIDEDKYENEQIHQNKNYITINSIFQAAKDKNIPIVLALGIYHESTYFDIITPQDIVYYADSFHSGDCNKPGENTPSFYINRIKANNKTFTCEYIIDDNLKQNYLYPDLDFITNDMSTEDYSKEYIELCKKYANYGKNKQQLSAIFIKYTLDIGDFPIDEKTSDSLSEYYNKENYKWCSTKIETLISQRLKNVCNTFNNKVLNNSIFKYINENFYNKTKGIYSTLHEYNNYCIIFTQLKTKKYEKYSITYPDEIYYENHILDIGQNKLNEIDDYCFNKDIILKSDYDGRNYIDIYQYSISAINNICTLQLEDYINSTYKYIKLDEDYFILDADNKLNDIIILNKYNFVDDVLSSGFFGLKHDITIQCKDSAFGEPIKIKYTYDSNKYVEPTSVNIISDKNETSNFDVGKWYYNAREIYNYAKENHKPCLFIYSLLGCGPCSVYQDILWNNPTFQEWFAKQKFLLCGLECESQPIYDQQLKFLVDDISTQALNFAKEDIGETLQSKQKNALNQQFKRYKTDDNSLASSLMTPVLIFMDKDGKCWDYTYHYIRRDLRIFGQNGLLQQLKSLCLYHFDNNNLTSPTYVVDAIKQFNSDDYLNVHIDYPFIIDDNIINMAYFEITSTSQAEFDIKQTLGLADLVIGGCEFDNIEYLEPIYIVNHEIMEKTTLTKTELNRVFDKYLFKIGNDYYKLQATGNAIKRNSICGDLINAYKLEWVLVK